MSVGSFLRRLEGLERSIGFRRVRQIVVLVEATMKMNQRQMQSFRIWTLSPRIL
jgi:hypothetical protein